MRYTVTKQRIDVIGYIWQPDAGLCAYTRDLSAHELEQIGNPQDRAAVAAWLDTHLGDFEQVVDFRADFHLLDGFDTHVVHEWEQEESEFTFLDCMYPEGD